MATERIEYIPRRLDKTLVRPLYGVKRHLSRPVATHLRDRLAVGRNVVIRWEGGCHRPSATRLKGIAKLGRVSPERLLHGGEGTGNRRDQQWEEAVMALRVAWADRRRRAALLMVLRAVAGMRE